MVVVNGDEGGVRDAVRMDGDEESRSYLRAFDAFS
jgi:hypothetical protein